MVHSMFIPSDQQVAFFDWIKTGKWSCVLEAVAVAGKTTTLVKALHLMEGNVLFGAYNKAIVEDIKSKAPKSKNITISTLHTVG